MFDEFYESGYRDLVAAISVVTGDLETARDAVDEALARAWAYSKRGKTIDCLGAWTRVVALNLTRGRFRRLRTERQSFALSRFSQQTVQPVDVEGSLDLRRALATLPFVFREVTVLHYYFDLSVAEIAAELGVSEGTVKSRLHRARQGLAVYFEEPAPQQGIAHAV